MKKSILKLGKTLNKTEQKLVNGGFGLCSDYNGPMCYSNSIPGCGSCAEYNALPPHHKICALTDARCETQISL